MPEVIDFRAISDAQASDQQVIAEFFDKRILSTNKQLNRLLLTRKSYRDKLWKKLRSHKKVFSSLDALLDSDGDTKKQQDILDLLSQKQLLSREDRIAREAIYRIAETRNSKLSIPAVTREFTDPPQPNRTNSISMSGPAFAPMPRRNLGRMAMKGIRNTIVFSYRTVKFNGKIAYLAGKGSVNNPTIAGAIAGGLGAAWMYFNNNYTTTPVTHNWYWLTPLELIGSAIYAGAVVGGTASAIANVKRGKPVRVVRNALAIVVGLAITPPVALGIRDDLGLPTADRFFTYPSKIAKKIHFESYSNDIGIKPVRPQALLSQPKQGMRLVT